MSAFEALHSYDLPGNTQGSHVQSGFQVALEPQADARIGALSFSERRLISAVTMPSPREPPTRRLGPTMLLGSPPPSRLPGGVQCASLRCPPAPSRAHALPHPDPSALLDDPVLLLACFLWPNAGVRELRKESVSDLLLRRESHAKRGQTPVVDIISCLAAGYVKKPGRAGNACGGCGFALCNALRPCRIAICDTRLLQIPAAYHEALDSI